MKLISNLFTRKNNSTGGGAQQQQQAEVDANNNSNNNNNSISTPSSSSSSQEEDASSSSSCDNTTMKPIITFSDKSSTPLEFSSQETHVQITLPLAKITTTMTFVNTRGGTLEGQLVFPLPEDATMIGYAVDVNGQLVDAVPVEKEKAEVIFEEEVRSHKGAAIVQMATQSNTFKTRIYPLPHNVKRTVKVVYTMPVDTRDDKSVITIPFGIPSGNNVTVSGNIQWYQKEDSSLELSVINSGKVVPLEKQITREGSYTSAVVTHSDLNASSESLVITSTQKLQDDQIFVEDNYFGARMKVKVPETETKINSDRVQILWDCSFGRHASQKRDLELLKQILDNISAKEVVCTPFSLFVSKNYEGTFTDSNALLKHIESIPFDGATDISNLEELIDPSATYSIVFTDGIHTLGRETTPDTVYSIPLYIISTAASSNSPLLSHIATKSGGRYLNAARLDDKQIVDQVGKPVLYFLVADYESEQFEEVYPNEPIAIDQSGYFQLYGKVKASGEIAVTFKYGIDIVETKVLQIEPVNTKPAASDESRSDRIIPMLWVKQKMNSLSVFPHLFEQELRDLAREWSIVTPNTSLIVLEDAAAYIKHKIVPPVSLPAARKAYFDDENSKQKTEVDRVNQKIANVISKWQSRVTWHQTVFAPPPPVEIKSADKSRSDELFAPNACAPPPPMGGRAESLCDLAPPPMPMCARVESQCESMSLCDESMVLQRSSTQKSKKKSAAPMMFARRSSASNELRQRSAPIREEEEKTKEEAPSAPSASASINIQKWSSDAQYMTAIKTEKDPYKAYLQQRVSLMQSPAFFLDVADYWLTDLKQMEQGITILTNILELELESVQLLRIVGYRLDQAKQYDLAEIVFEQVKKMRPDEPQSHRDLALIKEKLGKYAEAVDLFNKVITGQWNSNFDEIELTAAIELNHCLVKDPSLKPCDERFRYHMDLDLRISMAWDTVDTDIDLHVHEKVPNGEHCYYGHRSSKIGGMVSRDFTRGYGPEEYMLHKAPSGAYQIKCRYYSNHQQTLTGGTTILCTFFTNYMRPDEKSETVTVRLSSNQSDFPVCEIKID